MSNVQLPNIGLLKVKNEARGTNTTAAQAADTNISLKAESDVGADFAQRYNFLSLFDSYSFTEADVADLGAAPYRLGDFKHFRRGTTWQTTARFSNYQESSGKGPNATIRNTLSLYNIADSTPNLGGQFNHGSTASAFRSRGNSSQGTASISDGQTITAGGVTLIWKDSASRNDSWTTIQFNDGPILRRDECTATDQYHHSISSTIRYLPPFIQEFSASGFQITNTQVITIRMT